MAINHFAEKDGFEYRSFRSRAGRVAIVLCQHILMWSTLYIAASAIYTLAVGVISTLDIPVTVLLLVASILSLFYIALHNTTAHLQRRATDQNQCEKVDSYRKMAIFILRILMSVWLVTCAISVTFTVARHPLCELRRSESGLNTAPAIDIGSTCIIHRVAILTSAIALFVTTILFVLLRRVSEPFRCHLFGIVQEDRLLPLQLPYKPTKRLTRFPTQSTMSFQCRSSQSLSRENFAPWTSEEVRLLPPSPRSVHNLSPHGLGIHNSRSSAPPLCPSPRIPVRSHAPLPLPPPPPSPIQSLPTYLPNDHWTPPPIHKAIHPPKRPARPSQTFTFESVHSSQHLQPPPQALSMHHLRPPPSALSPQNLDMLDRSLSRSSIYSRSTSGESRPVPGLSSHGSSGSLTTSSSASTLRSQNHQSPLKEMQTMEEPERVVLTRLSSWELDDGAALEASVAPVRFSSKSGIMISCHVEDCMVESPVLRGTATGQSLRRTKSCKLVKVRRVRESGVEHNMF